MLVAVLLHPLTLIPVGGISMDKLFINNKYSKMYFNIIEKAIKENRVKLPVSDTNFIYYESHHIIPRSLGGNKEQVAILTAKEHFICHLLLCKMTTGKARSKMLHALKCMQEMKGKEHSQQRYSSKLYQKLKEEICKAMSDLRTGVPNYKLRGHKRSKEFKEKLKKSFSLSDKHKNARMKNLELATAKNLGKKRSDEFKNIMKLKMKNRKFSSKTKQDMSKSAKERSKIKACCIICHKELPTNSFGSHRRFCN